MATLTPPTVTGGSPRPTLPGPQIVFTITGRQGMSRQTVRSQTLSQPFRSTGDHCSQQPSPMDTSRETAAGAAI